MSATLAEPAVAAGFHRLRIADLRRETEGAVSLAFAVPADLRETFAFVPGQYLTLRTMLRGEEVRRSYSICAGRDEAELRVAVKHVPGGVFSAYANTVLRTGDVIEVAPPAGRFGAALFDPRGEALGPGATPPPSPPATGGGTEGTFPPPLAGVARGGGPRAEGRSLPGPMEPRTHIAIAAGSGITPILSILRSVLAADQASRFVLLYGSRRTADILFREALEDLKDRHLERLSVVHVLSREAQDIAALNGRLDAAKLREVLPTLVRPEAIGHALLCGPAGMIEDAQAVLAALGLPPARIHSERFTAAGSVRPTVPPPAVAAAAPHAVATIVHDGATTDVPMMKGERVLDAALRAGLDLPWSCRGGMCSTCRARLLEGQVEMAQNFSLEPWETQAGYVLTCQARPLTPHVRVDYDHV
jgi:ring-1,2-phenylacetyl-CoA epoxidase subunit PaaE